MKHFQDVIDKILVRRRGYGHYQKRAAYLRMGVNAPQSILMPAGSEIIGLKVRLGDIHLVTLLSESLQLEERIFYAYNDGQYMSMPNLACVDTVIVGTTLWFVFEDDMAWINQPSEDDRCRVTSHSSAPPQAGSPRSWRPTRR